MVHEPAGTRAGGPFSPGVRRLTEIYQQTADGARGAWAARLTNCQTRPQPGGAPVEALSDATGVIRRRPATDSGKTIP